MSSYNLIIAAAVSASCWELADIFRSIAAEEFHAGPKNASEAVMVIAYIATIIFRAVSVGSALALSDHTLREVAEMAVSRM